jgi:trimethylamine--corrinoid protein Co-methyltransferase
MPKPILYLLSEDNKDQIIQEAIEILEQTGVLIHNLSALSLLEDAGAAVDKSKNLVRIPRDLIHRSLKSCPSDFSLYNQQGQPVIDYGKGKSSFAPGSSALTVLDRDTQKIRLGNTKDLIEITKVVEGLDQIEAQSTAIISSDVPQEISDLYRLYVVLRYSSKPIITGAFYRSTLKIMIEMLELVSGGEEALYTKPRAIFDVCPTSPLQWGEIACQNLIDCAQKGIPIQIVPMPLAGATAPVTLGATIVQHTAECLSGLVISQVARKGAPVVWGGSPAIFDMQSGMTALGSGSAWLLGIGYAQIGQALKLPTQSFLGISDAKILDAQAGFEASSLILGACSGVDLLTGTGMLAQINCQSLEKLVFDAECITLARYLSNGITFKEEPLAHELIKSVGHHGNFLSHDHTLNWFREENYFPSQIIDRNSPDNWNLAGSLSARQRSGDQIDTLLFEYSDPQLEQLILKELKRITLTAAAPFGMNELPLELNTLQ